MTTAAYPSSISLCAPLNIEAAASATSPAVEGQAGTSGKSGAGLPRFRMVAYTGGPMRIAGWRYPIVVDLAGLSIPSQNRPIRFSHDPSSAGGVGHSDTIRVEAHQLVASGLISRDTAVAREVVASSKNGFPWQASIGANVDQVEFLAEGHTAIVNGQTFTGPLNIARRATLGEISFVDLGADGNSSATIAASHLPAHPSKESTMPPGTPGPLGTPGTDPAPGTPGATPKPETTPPTPAPAATATIQAAASGGEPTPEQIRAAAIVETDRIAAVRRACNPKDAAPGSFTAIEAQAIREGWDANRTELEVLRAGRPKAPMIMKRGQDALATGQILEAACILSARLTKPEDHCEEQILEAASKQFRHGIGLQELILEAAIANGYTGHSFRADPHTIMRMAFAPKDKIEAGFSNIDLAGILANVANKFLLEGFFSVERTWRNLCAVRNVADFKTVTSYRLIGTDQYELVPPGGQLKHGNLGNETYSNKADTYGLRLGIDRRDIINDDLGATTTVPRKLGRGSGLKINDVFWTIYLGSSTFFATGNKNLLTGTGSVLGIDGLSAAEQAFLDQVDSDGKPIGVMPVIMLVPTALSAMSAQLYKSLEIRDTTANTKTPISNPHQGKFRVEVSRYLGNTKYTGNSQKAWYLLADPNDLPVIEVAFLNGNEAPTIDTADADFSQLGIQMRGYHDFGVALQDPRGGVKSKGEA